MAHWGAVFDRRKSGFHPIKTDIAIDAAYRDIFRQYFVKQRSVVGRAQNPAAGGEAER